MHYTVATMNPEQEKALIEQCRADPAAFGQVFDSWYKPVFGYVMRRTADYDVSKDIAAETFLKAFLKINTFRWRGISLSAWLYRIATNELNQYYRSSNTSRNRYSNCWKTRRWKSSCTSRMMTNAK